jgi:hypothetical protein
MHSRALVGPRDALSYSHPMSTPVQLLTSLDEAQLRRLEPHLYHLIVTGRARASIADALERIVELDAAPNAYAVLLEALGPLSMGLALPFRHACHVSIISRSPITFGVARAADAVSQIAGGPSIECFESLEAAYAAAQRAIALHA